MTLASLVDKIALSVSLDWLEQQELQTTLGWSQQNAAELDGLFNRSSAPANLRVYGGAFIAGTGDEPEAEDTTFSGNFMLLNGVTVDGEVYNVGGMNAGVLQWGARNSDGKFYAGAGAVTLGVDGINIVAATSVADVRSYHFTAPEGNVIGGLYAASPDAVSDNLEVKNITTKATARTALTASGATGGQVTITASTQEGVPSKLRQIVVNANGNVQFNTNVATHQLGFAAGTETYYNEAGLDIDFRIESDVTTHAFFMQGSDGFIGINKAAPVVQLDVVGAGAFTSTISASNFSGSSSGTNTGDVTLAAIGAIPNANGATLAGQALTLQPASASFGGVVTTGAQTFAGAKTLTSPIFITPALGTPASGNLANCTFPTLNQNTTGSAASLSISGQTGLLTFVGLLSTNRIKTVRDAADTILELGGSYTPTGTWTSLTLVTPVLGTPVSGNLANCTFPTLNQNTSGSAASLSVSGQTGLLTFTGITSTNRAKTVRDAADTILELGGSYAPTGTWTNMTLATPNFTGTATGVSLSLSGSIELKPPVTVGAATYNQLAADSYLIANRAGTITITLLTASSFPGHRLVIKTIQAQTVVSASSNVVPRTDTAAGTAILPATDGAWCELVSDGTNWVIMAGS